MKFAIVVVLYQKKIADWPLYPLLDQIFALNIPVVCYDNSTESQTVPITNPLFTYYHAPKNEGIAAAYNYGLKIAEEQDCAGLLLLDHDSTLSLAYLKNLQAQHFEKNVGAIVPKVIASGQQVSPLLAKGYVAAGFTALASGEYAQDFTAINSGSLLSLKFLAEIGGFNLEFPLDFLDHWLFFAMQQHDYRLVVLNFEMQHDLSVLGEEVVSHERYASILKSETLFYTKYRTDLLAQHKKQLLKRVLKYLVKSRDSFYWKTTWHEYRTLK